MQLKQNLIIQKNKKSTFLKIYVKANNLIYFYNKNFLQA